MGAGGGGTVDVEDVLDEDDPPIYTSNILGRIRVALRLQI